MKSVLISIQPYWVFLIIAKAMGWNIGKQKTDEIRKNYPKANDWDKTTKIYCSKNKNSFAMIPKEYQPLMQPLLGKVIGEFVCDCIKEYESEFVDDDCFEWIASIDRDEDGEITGFYEWTNELDIPYTNTDFFKKCCIGYEDLKKYIGIGIDTFYAWHISGLVIYDKPKELRAFRVIDNEAVKECPYRERIYNNPDLTNGAFLLGSYLCRDKTNWCTKCKTKPLTHPPQSWCYVEVLENG